MSELFDFLEVFLKVEILWKEEKVTFFASQNNRLAAIISCYAQKSSKFFLVCKKIFPLIFIDFDLKDCI